MIEDLKPLVLAMEDFINQPSSRDVVETPEVRDYRHEAYRVWSPLCRAILDAARTEGLPVGGGGEGLEERPEPAMERRPNALPADVSDTGKDADICSRGDRCVCQDPSPSRCNAFKNPDALPPGYGRTDQ